MAMTDLVSWTAEQILALAPDPQVGRAAQGLLRPAKWQALGSDERALWGEQRGSASAPYQVAIDLTGPACKCSCPSHKRPCKHALGLFLLAQSAPKSFPQTPPPDWVVKWLGGRAAAASKKARAADEPVADAAAQARRAARRDSRVQQGAEALATWLQDLVRQGLGSLPGQPANVWETQAARLVDAQAPGLARLVRDAAAILHSGEGWPDRLLAHLARLHLLLEAYSRLDSLPPDLQAEVRTQVGWAQDQAAVRSQPGLADRWLVVGQRLSVEDQLTVRRTWLWGHASRRAALILDFAAPGQNLDGGLVPGMAFVGELAFWPGVWPSRALVKSGSAAAPLDGLPGYSSLRAALSAYGTALAATPWLERFLVPVENVVPVQQGDGWAVCDAEDGLLPLTLPPLEGWRLLALGGGQPLTLVGEWDGAALRPLSVWTGREFAVVGAE